MILIDHTEGLVAGSGLYRMPAAVYHADPAPEPSLSSSVALEMIENTPLHGRQMHPRLRVADTTAVEEDEDAPAMSMGSVVHELLLGAGGGFAALPFKDFRTKDAKAARAEAVAAGKTPILRSRFEDAQRMAERARARLKLILGAEQIFDAGASETAVVWRDELGLWGRCMVDRWGPTPFEVWDVKTTTAGLSDKALNARVAEGIDLKAAWYRRGLEALHPELRGRIRYRLIWIEQSEPFEVRIKELPGEAWHYGREKALTAAVVFRECLHTGRWPGYPNEISSVEYPGWAADQWEKRRTFDPAFSPFATAIMVALSHQAPLLEAAE